MTGDQQKKGERPKKPKKPKNYYAKTRIVQFRLPIAEVEKLEKEAKECSTKLSPYCKKKFQNGSVTVRRIDSKFEKLIYELNMNGNNLRQAVRLFHTHGDPFSVSEDLSKAIKSIAELIAQANAKIDGKE